MQKLKRPVSIILSILMVVSMFVAVPVTASAADYVAEVNGTQYETLEDAFDHAVDGDTITLLANCNGNGIIAPQGKFNNQGLTVDFNGYTYTVDGNLVGSTGTETQAFQLLRDNNITFKNGTIYSEKALFLVQNYSNLTLEGMTLTLNNSNYAYAYTLSNNNGNVVIEDTTINANPAGGFAFDVCRYSSYPSVNVTVKGNSVINGNVEVSASGNTAKDGFSLTLESGEMYGTVVVDESAQTAMAATPEIATLTTDDSNFKFYVAQIGDVKYETLEAAFAAAVDGDTITVLADSAGNGIKVTPAGKFATGLTVDFGGHKYTVDGETVGSAGTETQAFQLLKDNKVTFKNGTIYSEKAKMLVQNYSDLTLDKMTLTLNNTSYNGAYTLSNNNGNTVIKDTTINANPTTGSFAFDVCRYSSYPSVNVTVTGTSKINGDVEIYASKSDAKDGFSLTLESGTMTGDIVLDQTAQNVIASAPDKLTITKEAAFEQAAPAGYKWDNNGELVPVTYVAQIGDDKYETLEAAFAAAVDGDAITVLADSSGNGIKVTPAGKFATGLTVDFDGHTYTVDGETVGSTGTETQAFQLLKDNKVTFKNGTIYSEKAKMLVQNYSDLTLDNMTLTLNNTSYNGAYTLSNNNGNTVIKDTTINANPTTGSFAFDVCRYSSYPSVDVTVTGDSVINGNVEIYASKGQAKDGFSLTLESGTMTGDIVVDPTAQSLIGEDNTITKADAFTKEAPADFEWVDNGDGTSSLSHVHDWDYDNVSWTFTENASHNIYAKYTLTCKTDPTHTKEQTGSGTLMSTVKVENGKFVYSHSAVKIDGNSVAIPNYTRNVADGIINQYELKAAVKVAGNYTLANDITGFYDNVKPVDGFVLDGQDHMIKYGTMNASGRVMFEAVDQNTKFTLKNITLDGNKRAKWAVCAYTGNSGKNAGNVITLDTVTIQNFKSNDYVGAINAFGSSTWNLKNCTITGNTTVDDSDGLSGSAVWAGSKATINIDGGTYDEVYLHSYSGTGAVLNADGGATINNLVLDLTKTDTLKANIDDATVGAITSNEGTIPEEAVVMDPAKATVAAPEGYKWVDSDETGMKTLVQIVYVAQIGDNKYETLEAAFAAAVDGDTITVLADCAGNGIQVLPNRFNNNGLTVDFDGHTYTMDGTLVGSTGTQTQAFQLQKNNKITLKDGTITSNKAKLLIQNYSDLTLDGMTLTLDNPNYTSGYTLSDNNGNVLIKDTTINANPAGKFAFDVCRGGGGDTAYPSVYVTVTGDSVINGDVEIDAKNGNARDGFGLTLQSGTMTGDIKLTNNAKTAITNTPDKAQVTKANTFTQTAPAGFKWVDNENGTSTLSPKYFYGKSITLNGNVELNFWIDNNVAKIQNAETATIHFTWDGGSSSADVNLKNVTDIRDGRYYVAPVELVAAQMAHKVKGELIINGTKVDEAKYSVQDYAEELYNNPSRYDDKGKPDELKALAKAMLNYGSEAQTVFTKALIEHPDRADSNVGQTDYSNVTAALVQSKINGTASDLNAVATDLNAKYYTNSLIYLQNNTLRIYFTPKTYPANMPNAGKYDGNLSNYYYYKDKAGIAAAELDDQQEFTVGNVKFYYSPLNYVVNVLNSGMGPDQKNLAKALFLYNQAANAYFG